MSVNAVSSTKKTTGTANTPKKAKAKNDIKIKFPSSKSGESSVKLPIISDVAKQAVNNITSKLKLKPYSKEVVKDYQTMLQKSQNHLIGLIKFYEGNRENYYEAYTATYRDNGTNETDTNGFGTTSNLRIKTLDQAYIQLEKDLVTANNEMAKTINVTFRLGKGFFESLPGSIREGLIDLYFNKGPKAFTKNKDLIRALKNKDYSAVIWNLQFLYSIYDTTKTPLPGLYRRSLSRAILAVRDIKAISAKEAQEADAMIDKLYKNAVMYYKQKNIDTKDLDDVYNYYKSGSTTASQQPATTPTGNSRGNKNTSAAVPANNNGTKTYRINQEKMGIFSIAKSMRPNSCGVSDSTGLLKAIMAEIIKINEIKTDGYDNNGYPKVGLQTRNTVLKLPTTIKFEGKTIKLNPPAEMEDLTPKEKKTVKKTSSSTQKTNTAAKKAPAAANEKKENSNIIKGFYSFVVDTTFEGKGAYAIARENYKKQNTNEITFPEFYKLFTEANSKEALEKIKIGDSIKVPLISGGKLPKNAVLDTPKQEQQIQKPQKKEEKNIVTRFFRGIYNRIFSKQQNLAKTMRDNTEVVYENDPNSIPFENVLKEKNKKITKYTYVVKKAGKTETYSIHEVSLDYKVKDFKTHPNETVWGISHRFGVDMEKFCKDNNIKDITNIKAGQTVNIKKIAYKIEKGETLLSISKKFNLTPDILMQLNGIDENETTKLEVGRMIELPGFMYKVQKCDTFESIAQKVCIDPNVLRNINGNKLVVGKEIRVLYNDPDYDQTPEAKKTKNVKGKKVEEIDMSKYEKILTNPKYRYLRYKTKVNGLVVANREEFLPTNNNGKLKGKTIIINAGHGYGQSKLPDPGAVVEQDGLKHEWILNYDNSLRLISQLQAQGARVIYLQGNRFLIRKAMQEKENQGDLFISVHANKGNGKDIPTDRSQFYYKSDVEKGKARTRSIKFAEIAEETFDKHYNSKKYSEVSTNDKRTNVLKGAVNTQKIPGIIWEVAFMDSPEGRKRLKDNATMDTYTTLMTQAVVRYFDKYKD